MAPTPKRSLKRTVASTVEGRSPRFLLGSLALAMVISLVAGLGIGIKVEQHRGKTKKAKPVAVAKKKTKPVKAKGSGTAPLFGKVVQSKPKFLVISARGRRVVILVVPKTHIEVTAAATSSDIVAGSRVRFALKRTTSGTTTTAPTTTGASSTTGVVTKKTPTAKEILIITAKTGVGALVSRVTSDSMTLRIRAGKFVTISTTGAKIRKTTPGQKAQITKGRRVLVKTFLGPAPKQKAKPKGKGKGKAKAKRVVKRRPIALEIVVLPVGFAIG